MTKKFGVGTFCKDRIGGFELIVVIKVVLHVSNVLFLDLMSVYTLLNFTYSLILCVNIYYKIVKTCTNILKI